MVFLTRLLGHLWKDHTNPFTGYKQHLLLFFSKFQVKSMSNNYTYNENLY